MRGLLTTVALTAGLLVVPTTARAADQCVDGATFNVKAEPLTYRSAQVVIGVGAACSDEAVTVQRADGTNTQVVPLPSILTGPFPTTGDFYAPVENGAGTWLITHVHHGSITYKLPTPSRFVVKRGVRVQVPSTVLTLPGQAVAVSGRADYYTSTGGQLPLANRVVEVSGRPLGGTGRETVLTRTRTDSSGLFRFNLRLTYETSLSVRVWTGSTIIANGYAPSQLRFRPRPTWLTGTAAPTTATVVRPGTKMSSYGHLTVMYSTGGTGPFRGQKVLVQTRPASDPTGPYSTVATATTTGSGYYYANWTASVDADVRVGFVSPYKAIASSYRWVRSLDVQ